MTAQTRNADRVFDGMGWLISAAVLGVFAWLLWDIVMSGLQHVDWAFLTAAPKSGGLSGGIFPVIVSSAWILLVCLSVAVPLSIATAVLLAEIYPRNSRSARFIQLSLDVLSGVPSIVFGLFGYAFFGIALGWGYSILSGGLTLACMILPLVIRAAEQSIRSVPDELRQAAAALAFSRTRTLFSVILPTATGGIIAAVVIGIARAMAETAALLFTSGYVARMPESVFDSGRSLSVHVYDLAMNVNGGEPRAYATACVLLLFLLAINIAAAAIGQRYYQKRSLL